MKRWITTVVNTHTLIPAACLEQELTPLLADSLEVLEVYYHEKIEILESSLKCLNLLENAREITFICREIRHARTELTNIQLKKSL